MGTRYVWQKYDRVQAVDYYETDIAWFDISEFETNRYYNLDVTQTFTMGTVGTAVSGMTITKSVTVVAEYTVKKLQHLQDDILTHNCPAWGYYNKDGKLYYGSVGVGFGSSTIYMIFHPSGYYQLGSGYTQGSTSYGYVSGTHSYAYPSNSYSGSYWYVYKGTDNIDPTAVSYSTTTPESGKAITISVTARSNTYGGTISYQYQYSTNGGSSWTTIATTTSKSRSVTIPKGSTQFMARVRASDNYGYTSSDYVTGSNLTVKNDSNFAGVGGAVKSITAALCVDGVVKTNVKMYHGVNGTVKQS